MKAWQEHKIHLVISEEIFEEYKRVGEILSKRYHSTELTSFLKLVAIYAEIYEPILLKEPVSRDPDDDKFIACALAAKVRIIVSGDRDLLDITGYSGIDILTPSNFVKEYL